MTNIWNENNLILQKPRQIVRDKTFISIKYIICIRRKLLHLHLQTTKISFSRLFFTSAKSTLYLINYLQTIRDPFWWFYEINLPMIRFMLCKCLCKISDFACKQFSRESLSRSSLKEPTHSGCNAREKRFARWQTLRFVVQMIRYDIT